MHGNVSFVELGTSDAERSRQFFERIFGWSFHPMAAGGGWFQAPAMRVGLHGDDPQPQVDRRSDAFFKPYPVSSPRKSSF
jgi:predicted enzyme related to lactoylglutathione lyase